MLTPRGDGECREQGYTMVELLIVMVLLGVVGSITVSSMVGSFGATARAQARIDAIHEIELATERIGRELRAADPLVLSATGNFHAEIGAEVYRDRKLYRYVYELQDPDSDGLRDLVQNLAIYDLDALADNDPSNDAPVVAPSRTLMTQVDNGSGGLVDAAFLYLDDEGNEIDCVPGQAGETIATCSSKFAAARQVQILLVRDLADRQDPITARTTLNIRNTRYVPGGTP